MCACVLACVCWSSLNGHQLHKNGLHVPSLPLYVHTRTHTTTVRLSVFQIRSAPKQRSRFEFLFCEDEEEEEEEEEDEIEELCSWFSFFLSLCMQVGRRRRRSVPSPPFIRRLFAVLPLPLRCNIERYTHTHTHRVGFVLVCALEAFQLDSTAGRAEL